MTVKKKLLAYRIEGSVASRLFQDFPEAAAASNIENPNQGIGAIINWNPEEMKELLASIKATKQLIKDNDLKQLLVFKDEVDDAGETFMSIAWELAAFSKMVEESEELDED